MITTTRNGWRVSRRLGVGDREHVRAGLLQVWCMDTVHVIEQVEGALAAAKKLGKTARMYINSKKLKEETPLILNHIIMSTMGQSRDHDIMEETDFSDKHCDWIIGRCDIIVQPVHGGTSHDLRDLIMEVWKSTGAREYLGGNPGKIPESELRILHPQFYGYEDELRKQLQE